MKQTNIIFPNMSLYNELRKHRGSMRQICDESGKSRQWVLLVLKGNYTDHDLLLVASNVLKNIKQAEQKKIRVINSNLKELAFTESHYTEA